MLPPYKRDTPIDPLAGRFRELTEFEQQIYDKRMAEGLDYSALLWKIICLCDAEQFKIKTPNRDWIVLRWLDLTKTRYIFALLYYDLMDGYQCMKDMRDFYGIDARTGFPSSNAIPSFNTEIFDLDTFEQRYNPDPPARKPPKRGFWWYVGQIIS